MANGYGLRCPECGQEDKFQIDATVTLTVVGDDVSSEPDNTWESSSFTVCLGCDHEGTAAEFSEDNQEAK
jgi:hypothetical protein